MILSMSGVVLLGIIVFLFFKKDGLKASHALVGRTLRLLPREHGHRAEHQGRRGEPGGPPRRDQVLTSSPTSYAPSGDSSGPAPSPPHPRQRHAQIARSRELARTAADSATDVLHPLITVTRGLRRLAAAGRRKWAATPKDRRGPLLFLVASVVLVVALVPYGPLLAVITPDGGGSLDGPGARPAGPDRPRRGADRPPPVALRGPRAVLLRGRGPALPVRPRRGLGEGLRLPRVRRRRAPDPAA